MMLPLNSLNKNFICQKSKLQSESLPHTLFSFIYLCDKCILSHLDHQILLNINSCVSAS